MSGVFRTPDDRFTNLPEFPWETRYVETDDGLRVAYIDEGDGPVVFLLHGMPSWSFLWRKSIPPLLEAGFRVVAPDLIGFGRSDKPTDPAEYSYPRHIAAVETVLGAVGAEKVHFVLHDWGGPIGTRVAANNPARIASATLMDTGFNTGDFKMSEQWQAFRDFVATAEELPIGFLIKGAVAREMPDNVFAAYEAPFPTEESKAGARAFPPMIPTSIEHPDAKLGQAALETFIAGDWPKLVLWADKDPVLPRKLGDVLAAKIGAGDAITIEEAGHFLQEDAGAEIGERVANFIVSSD
ncbi:MAG: haloalkane dehalogenase [Solirubrobacterales bacterium]